MMKKVFFVVPRYGLEVNGGVEVHCRLLAEKLSSVYHVEVLTSRIHNYTTLDTYYSESTVQLNGVTVRRFDTEPQDVVHYQKVKKKVVFARKVRRFLYRARATFLFRLFPVWRWQVEEEYDMLRASGFHSKSLVHYLETQSDACQAIIVMSYTYPTTHFSSVVAPEKTILIPAAHEESSLFHSMNTLLFSQVARVAFNTETEQKLCQQLFANALAKNSVVSVGVRLEPAVEFVALQHKYHIPERYVLYFGRVCESKLENLLNYFITYLEQYNGDIQLLMVGEIFIREIPKHPNIHFIGYVMEEEKTAFIKHAQLVINPSKHESLSLLLLESMSLEKMVLTNGECQVMLEHFDKSNKAMDYYHGVDGFCQKLDYYLRYPEVTKAKGIQAKQYVDSNYNWDLVTERLTTMMEEL